MADLPTVFSESAASRIGAATRWAELQQGIPQDGYGSSPGNGMSLVRTVANLPSDYGGSVAALGNLIEKNQNNYNGNPILIAPVWIKDINNTALGPNATYQARYAGTLTQTLTVNNVPTPTTLGLYLVQQAIKEIEPHFYPEPISVDNQLAYWPLGTQSVYFPFGWLYGGNVAISTFSKFFSNIVRSNSNIAGIVNPILKIRRTSSSITFPNTLKYIIFEYYSDPIWVNQALTITSGTAGTAFGSFNTPVLDPAGIATAGGPGKYLCQWQMLSLQNQFYSYSNFVDFLTVVSKVPTPTTSGIGTGIGSGISGV